VSNTLCIHSYIYIQDYNEPSINSLETVNIDCADFDAGNKARMLRYLSMSQDKNCLTYILSSASGQRCDITFTSWLLPPPRWARSHRITVRCLKAAPNGCQRMSGWNRCRKRRGWVDEDPMLVSGIMFSTFGWFLRMHGRSRSPRWTNIRSLINRPSRPLPGL
jgi:hypothetical protein